MFVGTQKNRLNEAVLLSTYKICQNGWVKKYLQFYAKKICLSKPVKTGYMQNFKILASFYSCADWNEPNLDVNFEDRVSRK